jgi:hypothetical protein
MKIRFAAALAAGLIPLMAGCGLFYQAGSQIRASRMQDSLQVGQTALQVHRKWGEPDIRKELAGNVQVWSYAKRANSNDLAATLFYTSAKEGDTGNFLDLRFKDGKLISWEQAKHTMPPKEGAGVSLGMGGGGGNMPYGGGPGYGTGMGTGIAHY